MKLICAWCQLDLGRKAPFDDNGVSHGICTSCSDQMLKEMGDILNTEECFTYEEFLETI